jgi:hypothetical protein
LVDRHHEPGNALTRRILELGNKIGEIERVLATWPSEDGEDAFVRALGASVERLRDELEQTRALLERRRQTDGAPEVPEDLTPSDALDVSPNRAMNPPTTVASRKERSGPPKTHVFHIPWARDFEVTDDEWAQIQTILSSHTSEPQS